MKRHPKLIVIKRNGEDGSEYPVTTGRCEIGSDADCDVRMNVPGVEPVQCVLLVDSGGASLKVVSNNGHVEVNGRALSGTTPLAHGDVFVVHSRKFRFEWQMSRVPESSSATPTTRKSVVSRKSSGSAKKSATPTTRKSVVSRRTPGSSGSGKKTGSTPRAQPSVRKATPATPEGHHKRKATERPLMAAGKGISPLRNFYGRTPASGRKTGRHSGSAVHARVAALRGGAGASPKGGTPARRSLTQHAASSDPNKSAALMCIHAPRRWADVVKQGVPRTSSTCVQKRVAATAHRRRKFKNIVAASTGLCTPRVQTASTGHANSPATIVVGRSRVRKSTPSPNLSEFATPSIPTDVFVSPLSVTQEGGEEPVAGGSSARKSSLSTRTKPAKRSPSHKADYRDVRGVKRMFAKTSPASDFTDVGGVKRIFGKRSPAADYTDVTGVKRIFARASSSAGGDYAAVSPVARLFQTPVEGAPAPREGQSSAKGGEHRGSLSPVPRGTRRSQGLAKRQSSASSAGKEELPPSKRLRTQSPRGGGANVSSPQKEEKPPSSPQRLPVKETRRSSRKSGSLGGRRSPGKSPQKEVAPPRSPSKNSTLTRSPLGSKTPQEERQPAGARLRTRTSSPTRLPQRWTTRVSPARSPRKPASPERRPPAKTPSPTRSPRRATASRPSPVKTGSPSPPSKSPGPKSSVAAGREGKEAASPKGVQAGKAGASVQVQAQVLLAEAVAPAKPAKRSTPASTRGRAAVTTRTSAQDKSATPSETPVRRSGRGEEKTPVKRSARGKAGTPAEATGSSVKKSAGRSTGRTPAEAAATPGRRATRRAKAKEAAEAPTTPVKRGARGKKPAKEAPSSPRDAVVDAPAPAKEAPSSPRKVLADSPAPVKSTRGARRKASAEQETGSAVPAKSPPRRRAVRGAAKAVASSASSTPKKRTRGLGPASSQSSVSPVNPAQDEEEKPAAKLAAKSPLRGGKRQVTRRGGKQAEHPSSPPKAPAEEADLPATPRASRRRAASKKHPSSPPKATAEEADLPATPRASRRQAASKGHPSSPPKATAEEADLPATTRASRRQAAKKPLTGKEGAVRRGRRGAIVEALADVQQIQELQAKLSPIKEAREEGPTPAKLRRTAATRGASTGAQRRVTRSANKQV